MTSAPGTADDEEGPIYELTRLSRTFGRGRNRVDAVRDVDLSVHPGQRLGIVGESGSGKTTLIKMMAALDRPTGGQLSFRGRALGGLAERELGFLRAQVAMVFQDPRSSLNPRMKVGQIITEPLRSRLLKGRADVPADHRARLAEVIEAVDLPGDAANQYPHEFSGGQRQRIGIARALASRPRVLIADEPVSALDVSVRAQVLNLLADLVDQHALTLIFVSHDLAVVRHVCDTVAVMRHGEIVEAGPTAQVYDEPRQAYTAELLAAVPRIKY